MNILLGLIFVVAMSFSVQAEELVHNSKPKVKLVNFDNPSSGLSFSSDYIGDPRKVYLESLDNGRISNDPAFSCYETQKSTNYVNLPESIVSQLRLYASDQQFEIAHRTTVLKSGTNFRSISSEEKLGQLSVRKRICFKTFNGITVRVISELYKRKNYE